MIGCAVLVVVAVSPGLLRLRLRTDGNALLPVRSDALRVDRQIRSAFGVSDQLVIVVRSPHANGVFNKETLVRVQRITQKIESLEGIHADDVISLATERGARVTPGTLEFRTLLDPLPTTADALTRLREDVHRIGIYVGTIVAYDDSATCILVGFPQHEGRMAVLAGVANIIKEESPCDDDIAMVGGPIAEALLGQHILSDLGVPVAWLPGGVDTDPGRSPESTGAWLHDQLHHPGLLPLVLVLIFAVFAVGFRSLTAAVLPLLEVGACLICVFALMGWCDVPVYLTIAVLPVIVAAIGIADEVHVFTRYQQLLRQSADREHENLVRQAMDELWAPICKTSITTLVAFLAFCLSPLPAVRAFGAFVAFGVLFCMFWSLTVIPASLTVVPPRWLAGRRKSTKPDPGGVDAGWLSRLAGVAARHPASVLTVALVIAVGSFLGVTRLVVQDSWIGGFARTSRFYTTTQFVNRAFAGGHLLYIELATESRTLRVRGVADGLGARRIRVPAASVVVPDELVGQWATLRPAGGDPIAGSVDDTMSEPRRIKAVAVGEDDVMLSLDRPAARLRPGSDVDLTIEPHALLDRETIERVCRFSAFVRDQKALQVGGVLGPCGLLRTVNFIAHAQREEHRVLPDTAQALQHLWQLYELVWGQARRRQVITNDLSRCLVTVFLKNANYRDVGTLIRSIRDYEHRNLAPDHVRVRLAGDTAASQAMIESIVATQVSSLLGALAGILVVVVLLGRSVVWGIVCVLPCCLAVLVNFGVMGWMGMPLGVATSMFASMTLGIGVDFAIHMTDRLRLTMASGMAPKAATLEAASTMGPAFIIDTLAVAIGFGVLVVSDVPANARLGVLVVLSAAGCLLWTLLLLPALSPLVGARRG